MNTIKKRLTIFLPIIKSDQKYFHTRNPRSGTTLIESIIASNDEVTSGGELLSAFKLIDEFVNNKEDSKLDVF